MCREHVPLDILQRSDLSFQNTLLTNIFTKINLHTSSNNVQNHKTLPKKHILIISDKADFMFHSLCLLEKLLSLPKFMSKIGKNFLLLQPWEHNKVILCYHMFRGLHFNNLLRQLHGLNIGHTNKISQEALCYQTN